jgi:predicted transcriptional regulator
MARKRQPKLTPLESLVMDCVWDLREATVREVKDRLDTNAPRAYNTVLTVLRILRDKGFVTSERKGRADVYRPVVTRNQASRRPLRELLDRFYAGSAMALVSQLLDTAELDPEQMRAIRREVDAKLREGAEKGSPSQ